MKKTDYAGLVQVIKEEVDFAMQHKCLVEDAQGRDKEHQISDISVHILDKLVYFQEYLNSYQEFSGHDRDTHMLVRIYKQNKEKTTRSDYILSDVPLDPANFKIFFRQKIDSMMRKTLNSFFYSKKIFNKNFIKSKDPAEIYLENISELADLDGELANKIVAQSKRIYLMPSVTQVSFEVKTASDINIVVDSEGRQILEQKFSLICSISTLCFNSQKYHLNLENEYVYSGKAEFMQRFDQDMLAYVEGIGQIDRLTRLESGFYPMLFTPHTTDTLFHEALLAHLLCGDPIVNDETTIFKLDRAQDQPQAEKVHFKTLSNIKIIVDPGRKDKFGSYKFDAEGVRAKKLVLIDKGVIKDYLHSRNSAVRLNTTSNGHSRAGGFVDIMGGIQLPESRLSHFIIKNYQTKTTAELVKDIEKYCLEHGYEFYLKVQSYEGSVNPETGNFSMNLEVCEKIYLNGRKETIVGGNISGSPYELLSYIQAIGSETTTVSAYCGATSGNIPVSSEVPCVFFFGNYVASKKPEPDPYFNLDQFKIIPEDF
jgi:TldD protein